MNIKYYFNLARRLALKPTKVRRAYCIGAVAIRNDGVIVGSSNGYAKDVEKDIHAEARVLRKSGKGCILFIVRVARKDRSYKLVKPCSSCMAKIRAYKIKKVYYSISNEEYGVIQN